MLTKFEFTHTHTNTQPATLLERLGDLAILGPRFLPGSVTGEGAVAAFRQKMFSPLLQNPQQHPGLPELINKKNIFFGRRNFSVYLCIDIPLARLNNQGGEKHISTQN